MELLMEIYFYFSTSQVPNVDPSFPFTFSLTSTQGANLVSTATLLIVFHTFDDYVQ